MKRRLLQILIVSGCVLGFFIGLHASRPATAPQPRPSGVSQPESLLRPGSESPLTTREMSELAVAARDNDADALGRLRQGPFKTLTRKQLDQLVAMIDEEPDGFRRGRMVDAIAERWAELDPDKALSFVRSRVHRNHQESPFTRIFEVLAGKDPARAYQSYLEIVDGTEFKYSLSQGLFKVFEQWKKRSPEEAMAALESEGLHENNAGSALYGAVRSENETERLGIFGAIEGLGDEDLKREAWGKAVYSWAKTAPLEDIVTWLDVQSFDSQTTESIEREVARRKARNSPRAMADWLAGRATTSSLPGHLQTAVEQWAHMEPNACAEWLQKRDFGPETDGAVAAFTRAAAQHDIESAFTWAQSIHQDEQRLETLSEVARRWYRQDNESLKTALANSALSPEEQMEVLENARPD
ncbi:MAG: hypothetical protein AAF514_00410 [Verrucomicrobiota bacterium]